MEAKQYASEKPTDHWTNQKGNQNIPRNNNENTTTQNPWDVLKAMLRGKFIAIQAYLKNKEKHWINNLTLHLKQLEKERKKKKNPKLVEGKKS